MEITMKRILLLAILTLNILPSNNEPKKFEPNAKHTGPIWTGQENKPNIKPHDQWAPSQPYVAPQYRQQDNCILN